MGGGVVRFQARWDAPTVTELERLSFLGTNCTSLSLSPDKDSHWLALGDWAGNIQVWDFPAHRLTTNLVIRDSKLVFALLFSPGSHFLNAGAMRLQGRVISKFWEVGTWREIPLQDFNDDQASDYDFHCDERQVALSFADGTAGWWDLLTGERKVSLRRRIHSGPRCRSWMRVSLSTQTNSILATNALVETSLTLPQGDKSRFFRILEAN